MKTEYLETFCPNCVLRVTGDSDEGGADGSGRWRQPYVEIHLFSAHRCIDANDPQTKVRRVVAALRTEPLPWLEFYSAEEVNAFMATLARARDTAFPAHA